jgi:hypothetical protein
MLFNDIVSTAAVISVERYEALVRFAKRKRTRDEDVAAYSRYLTLILLDENHFISARTTVSKTIHDRRDTELHVISGHGTPSPLTQFLRNFLAQIIIIILLNNILFRSDPPLKTVHFSCKAA